MTLRDRVLLPDPRRVGDEPDYRFTLANERTFLAWIRAALALAAGGMAQVVFGAVLLVWSGVHYEELHGTLRRGTDVVHPSATHWVGLATVAGTGASLMAAIVVTLRH